MPDSNANKIKVLIVEDSITARTMLKMMLESAPDIRVVDTARDPFDAVEKMKNGLPDVILLDIEMPRMDGLTFLRRIMSQHPLPVVICSNHTAAGSDTALKALSMGAVEVLSKGDLGHTISDDAKMRICDVVRAASHARVRPNRTAAAAPPPPPAPPKPLVAEKKLSADVIMPRRSANTRTPINTPPLVAMGASTGGTDALAQVLEKLEPNCAPIIIVQHMPERFTEAFARRLNGLCKINVKEAAQGDILEPGSALIAPGHSHVTITREGRHYRCNVVNGPFVCRHRPSVDVLFRSVSIEAGSNVLGVLMTGMGDDGAEGMVEMKEAGAVTLAQNEASCVVYGMPREAVLRGGASREVHLNAIAQEIMKFSSGVSVRA